MGELELFHAQPYDPVKAHEYYLKNRELKGRGVKVKDLPSASRSSTSSGGAGRRASKPKVSEKQKRLATQARIAALKTRLDKLTAALDKLMKEAVERDSKKSKSKTENHSPRKKGSDGLTAAQEAKRKRDAHDYYEKNKKPAAKKPTTRSSEKDHQAEIDKVKAQIRTIRAQLKAAIAQARQASHTNTATRSR